MADAGVAGRRPEYRSDTLEIWLDDAAETDCLHHSVTGIERRNICESLKQPLGRRDGIAGDIRERRIGLLAVRYQVARPSPPKLVVCVVEIAPASRSAPRRSAEDLLALLANLRAALGI